MKSALLFFFWFCSFDTCFFLQVVFRPQPSKFQELRKACTEFRELMSICSSVVIDNLNGTENLQLVVEKACSWQVK
jgi:hypothetical protein